MDEPGTVFYLTPFNNNKYAEQVIDDPANRDRRCWMLDRKPALRIGLNQPLKSPPHLARFGRHPRNDVILGQHFSRNDQCYFDFNKDTGELLLHDLSQQKNTGLFDIDYTFNDRGDVVREDGGPPQIWKTPRQCVVVLSPDPYRDLDDRRGPARKWIFTIKGAEFFLIPRRVQGDEAVLTQERLAFAGQPDPDRTIEGTLQRIFTLGLQSLQSQGLATTYQYPSTVAFNPHNTRFQTDVEAKGDKVIRYTKLGRLGRGAQGDVHKVVDMFDGTHYACKILVVRAIPDLNIFSENDFRRKTEREVKLVQELRHDNIVPYKYAQGFKSQQIEIFMPIYQGSLYDLIQRERPKGLDMLKALADRMLSQILAALDYVHTKDPQIIHRDIKPQNILYQDDKFLLTDFGIAKVVDTSRTFIGSKWYAAPEVWLSGEQTPKVDIYGLGATVVECLVELPSEQERLSTLQPWSLWHRYLQAQMDEHAPQYTSILANDAGQRPTARYLLDHFFKPPVHALAQILQTNITWTNVGGANQHSTAPTPMDWTRTVATASFEGNFQSTQQPLYPRTTSVPSPVAPPNRPAQPRVGRGGGKGGSVKSARSAEQKKKGHKRNTSSQPGSQSAGVHKRKPGGKGKGKRGPGPGSFHQSAS